MRKYVTKLLCVLAVVLVFGMSFFLGMEKDLTKLAVGTIADNKLDDNDPCTSGKGTQYYVTANINIRQSWSQNSKDVGDLKKCEIVTVYCANNGWGKISKVGNFWASANYLSPSKPQGCRNTKTTQTKNITPISYKISNPIYTPAPGMDQMYSNKRGEIKYELTNVKNLANDDDHLIRIAVFQGRWPNSKDITDKFVVETDYSDGKGYIKLTQNDPNMPADTFYTTIYVGDQYSEGWNTTSNVKYSEFTIVGKYYDFSIIQEESGPISNHKGNPASEKNEFIVKITDLVDATDYSKFSYKMEYINPDGSFGACYKKDGSKTNCLNKFDVKYPYEENGQKNKNKFYFSNKYKNENDRPLAGTYRFYIYYEDTNYSSARGKISDYYEFEIGNRAVTFERQDIYSQRYVRSQYTTDYAIQLTRIQDVNGERQLTFIEGGKTITMMESEFLKTYTDFGIDELNYNGDGHIVYNFDGDKFITYYNPWYVGYNHADGTWVNSDPTQMNQNFPGVLDAMLSEYIAADDGRLNKVVTGTKTIKTKQLALENQILFATVGGRIKFTYKFENIYSEDFERAKITIKRDDGTVVGKQEGFSFDWRWDENKGEVIMYLTYDNEDEELAGDYTIYIEMNQIDTQEVPFSLYAGEIDFYLTSQIDSHLESSTPLATQYPPGNRRYEYYVGFYLVQGGKIQTTKNAKMIDVKIFDHLVDLDENGEMYYYNQIDYEVRLQSYLNGLVTYQVSENGGAFKTVTDEALATFTSKYKQAAEMLDKYTFDETTGAITGNNFELNITRFYTDEEIGDMQVVFTDAAGVETTMPLQDFKVQHANMYSYLITKFVFDEEDNIIPGAIIGSYKVTKDAQGEPIEGNDITHLFDITIDPAADNVEKPITVLPKTEVPAGEYFVYVTYDNLQGVGFINNADDAVITKELFPEMWEQNTHMTSIIYIDPEYSLEVHEPRLSNEGNDSLKIYNNIRGKARFEIDYNFIYDYSGATYKIEYFDGTTWVDAEDRFEVINSIDPDSAYYDIEKPYMELNTRVGQTLTGKYRLTVNYNNRGFTATDSKEFEIGGKYYGLLIEDGTEINFVHNFQETKVILAKTIFANNPGNIIPTITRKVSGGSDEILGHTPATLNASGKMEGSFQNASGTTVFRYQYTINNDYYDKENETLYEFRLTNVQDVTDVGNYELSFSYQEGTNDLSVTSIDFTVTDDEYFYQLSNEKPVANETGMYLYMDIDTRFINYEDLDDMYYIIYYYDFGQSKYIDVSSQTSDKKMFDIVDSWDNNSGPDYKGTLKISINEALVDMGGDYYIEAFFRDTSEEFDIGNLRKLFSWGITDLTIGSVYTEVENIDGVEVSTDIQLDAIYKNLGNANIDVTIESVYENDVKWTINKNCISTAGEEQCGPEGTDYNNRFNEVNTTGTNGKLKLTLKEGLTDKEMLEPGEYSLVLYYNSDNFNFVNFEVKSEYAEISIEEHLIYTNITEEKTVDGLFKNKEGKIVLYTKVRGLDYDTDLINVDITTSTGDESVMKHFILDDSAFAEFPHELVFTYDPKTNLEEGSYVISLSYKTIDGLIYDTFAFDMKPEYFNFYIGEPTYNPDPLYPNLENGGTATFKVETEDIPNVFIDASGIDSKTEKHVMAKNTRVYDADNNDVTENFTITAANHNNSVLDNTFDLNVSFAKNAVAPGIYTIKMNYEMYDYVVSKTQEFEIGGYKKDFKITGTEIITDTKDNRIHNNVGGTYRFNISTDFELLSRGISASVITENGVDVTDKFQVILNPKYIDLKYNATEPYVEAGKLTVTFTYQETQSTDIFTTGTEVTMYGRYVDLKLTNYQQSTEELYSDLENQYITFNIESASIKEEQKKDVILKIYDAEDFDVTNKFDITNNYANGGNVRIDIVPFEARVGEYRIIAYLSDETGDNNISNELPFEIEYNYYYVRFSNKTKFESVNPYEGDITKLYDRDGANAYYQIVSNYKSTDYSEFSIQIYQGLKLVKEVKADFSELNDDGVKYIASTFQTGALEAGKYDVAVAINGLPYNWKTIEIVKYIPVNKAYIYVNGIKVEDTITVYKGQTLNLTYKVEPENATNKAMTFSSSNQENILVDETTNKAYIYGEADTKIILKNKDYETSITIKVDARLSSDVYQIDYDKHIIFVNKMNAKSLDFEEFLSNLKAVVLDYKVLDKEGLDVTTSVTKAATDQKLVNGAEVYTIVVKGDINRDGKIGIGDVANLYSYFTGETQMNDAQIKAGDIREKGTVGVGDVAKLFSFHTGETTEI